MYDWLTRIVLLFLPQRSPGDNAPEDEALRGSASAQHGLIRDAIGRNKRSGQLRTETAHLSAHLDRCSTALQQACSGVEDDFLNIGERLQSIYSRAVRMTQNVQAAIEHIGLDGDNSTLATIIRTADRALVDLGLEQSRMVDSMRNVHSICRDLDKLRNMTGGLSRIAKTLKMVAININIESCRIEEARDSFSVLSQEIRQLSNTVGTLDRTLFSEIQAITTKLESMQKVMGVKLSRFAQLADDARNVADRAEPECRALMNRSVKALQQVGADGEAISQNTSQIVVNLQIHDNVSQRIAHITEALGDSLLMIQQLQEDGRQKCNFLEVIGAIDANLDLQQVQLTNIIDDVDQVFQNSRQAFKVIGHTVRDMTANIVQIARGDITAHFNGQSKDGSIGSLQAALEKIRVLIGQGDEAVDELKTIGRDATAAVARIGDLMEQVRKVNFDIHLKSLNAIFKSIHLGAQGRAIGVLVQEMKELAGQSKELVEQIESINSTIMDQAGQLQEHLHAGLSDGQEREVVSSDELDASIRNFSETSAAFTRHADEMAEASQSLDGMIVTAGEQLVFLKPFTEELRSQRRQLRLSRNRLVPWVTTTGAGAAILDKACLADRYTMKQERDIHTSVLASKTVKEDRPENGATGSEAVDKTAAAQEEFHHAAGDNKFGDNVELF